MLGYMTGKKTYIFFQQGQEISSFINKFNLFSYMATKRIWDASVEKPSHIFNFHHLTHQSFEWKLMVSGLPVLLNFA